MYNGLCAIDNIYQHILRSATGALNGNVSLITLNLSNLSVTNSNDNI